MAQTAFPDFTSVARFSDKEERVYKKLFDSNSSNAAMTPADLSKILLASGMQKTNLAKVWNAVCMGSNSVNYIQFKMMCKYVALWEYSANFQPQHFVGPCEPLRFQAEPYLSLYTQAVQEYDRSIMPANPPPPMQQVHMTQPNPGFAQPGYNQAPQYTASPSGASTPGGMRPSLVPGVAQVVSSGDFLTAATSWEQFTSEDLQKFRAAVGRLQSAVPGQYTNTELAEVIRSFQLPEKKDLTAIWKMVDFNNTRALSLEGAITLFWFLALAFKRVDVPKTNLPEPWRRYILEKVPPIGFPSTSTAGIGVSDPAAAALETQLNTEVQASNLAYETLKKLAGDFLQSNQNETNTLRSVLGLVQSLRRRTQEQYHQLQSDVITAKNNGPDSVVTRLREIVYQGEQERQKLEAALGNLQSGYYTQSQRHSDLEKANKRLQHDNVMLKDKIKHLEENQTSHQFGQNFAPQFPPVTTNTFIVADTPKEEAFPTATTKPQDDDDDMFGDTNTTAATPYPTHSVQEQPAVHADENLFASQMPNAMDMKLTEAISSDDFLVPAPAVAAPAPQTSAPPADEDEELF